MTGDQYAAAGRLDPVQGRGGPRRGDGTGRGWATVAFGLGVAVSVAANVAHTYYIPGASGRPPVGAQLAAAFYPLALLLVVEILARVPWPSSPWWTVARFGGASVVAGVAAVVSYRHMAALLAAYGEDALTAAIGPLAVDGLMVVASFALLAIGRTAHAEAAPAPAGLTWWPPFPAVTPLASAPGPDGPQVNGSAPAVEPEDDPQVIATARDRFAEVLATGDLPSVRAIRRELRIGHPRAVRVRQALNEYTGLEPSPGGTVER
ncbi:DUF2637 domain-containing protein [Actinomadura chokoriensis]|uniref:DUF2637 domain-containing protein n=1 Tax=Actinomadura chokoriensis TaxID=454156 RepID=UPI0031F8CC71